MGSNTVIVTPAHAPYSDKVRAVSGAKIERRCLFMATLQELKI